MTTNEIAQTVELIFVWGWAYPFAITFALLTATSLYVDGRWVFKYGGDDWGELIIRAIVWPKGAHSLLVFWQEQVEHWWYGR